MRCDLEDGRVSEWADQSAQLPASIARTQNFVGKSLYDGCTAFVGRIAELLVHQRALSPAEVRDRSDAPSTLELLRVLLSRLRTNADEVLLYDLIHLLVPSVALGSTDTRTRRPVTVVSSCW